jgi:hypothetical protein
MKAIDPEMRKRVEEMARAMIEVGDQKPVSEALNRKCFAFA